MIRSLNSVTQKPTTSAVMDWYVGSEEAKENVFPSSRIFVACLHLRLRTMALLLVSVHICDRI